MGAMDKSAKIELTEIAIENLILAMDMSAKEIIEMISNGLLNKFEGKLPETYQYLIDEMKETFL